MGGWAIIKETPSLLGLIPMALFLVFSFKSKLDAFFPVLLAVVIGAILVGWSPVTLGNQIAASLSSAMGILGLMVMFCGGLSIVLLESGISPTLCRWIVDKLKVQNEKQAILALFICQGILAFCVGSAGSSAAIVMPVFLPLLSATGVTPAATTVGIAISGSATLMMSPVYAGSMMIMELTGVDYLTFLLCGVIPIVLYVTGYFVTLYVQKKTKKEGLERYEAELSTETQPDASQNRKTLIFFAVFIVCIAFIVVTKQGMSFLLFMIPFLTAVAMILYRIPFNDGLNMFYKGCKNFVSIFLLMLSYQLLIDVINVAGGFEALSDLIISLVGDNMNESLLIIVATFVGSFGINAGIAAELQIMHELFLPMINQVGLDMRCWVVVLLAGNYLTYVIYPSMGTMSSMAICKSKNIKDVMLGQWVSSALLLIVCILYALIAPRIF